MLYPTCSGIDSDLLVKCNKTVLDIFSDTSLCPKHSSAMTGVSVKRKVPTRVQPRAGHKKVKVGVAKVSKTLSAQAKVWMQASKNCSLLIAS